MALWACLAFSLSTNAQSEQNCAPNENANRSQDTIIINPMEGIKIILIGKNSKDLDLYNNLDSIKTLFLSDIDQAIKNNTYPTDAVLTHYFVHPNGKRRLKAENEDFTQSTVDVKKEMRSMTLQLPPIEYILYALQNNYQCHIYVKDRNELTKLSGISLKDALAAATEDKQTIKQNTRIEIEKTNEHWMIKDKRRTRLDFLELSPAFGISLIGSRWSPTAAFDLSILFQNKYGIPSIKTGISYGVNSFADWNTESFSNMSIVASYDFKFMTNTSDSKAKWVGLQFGYMKSYEKSGPLHNRFKAGFVAEGFGAFNFGFDVIFLQDKKSVYGMTLKVPF